MKIIASILESHWFNAFKILVGLCVRSVNNVSNIWGVKGMNKHLLISLSLLAVCNLTYANVTILDNAELASVVVQTQQEQLQPVLPEYDANGQIGGVSPSEQAQLRGVPVAPVSFNPVDSPQLTPQLISQLNQILKIAL